MAVLGAPLAGALIGGAAYRNLIPCDDAKPDVSGSAKEGRTGEKS